MIRVRHIVRQYAPSIGGLESFVAKLAHSLNEAGCASDVLTLDRVFADPEMRLPRQETLDGISVRRVPWIGHRRMFAPLLPRKLLKGVDVLHVHGIDGMFERVARHPRLPGQACVATSHGAFFHTLWLAPVKQVYFDSVTKLAAQRYDTLIAISANDEQLMRRLGRPVVTIPNGIAPIGDFMAEGRDLLVLGRLSSHKRVDRLVAMMAEPVLADARLHVVGPDWDVRGADLARIAANYGVEDRVVFHGRISSRRLAEVARDCGVFVSASTYEGFGMSLIEAMTVGLVPVAHPNPSFKELVGDAQLGELVDFSDPARAAEAVHRQRDGITRERRAAAMMFAKRYSWHGHAERTMALYREQLDRPRLSRLPLAA